LFRIAYDEVGIDDQMYKIDLICSAEKSASAMGFDKETIEIDRKFRNRLLVTRRGRAYVYHALRNIKDITRVLRILKKDEKIRVEAVNALNPFIMAIKTMDTRKPMRLEKENFKTAIKVLDILAKTDKELIPAVSRIKQEIPLYVGKNLRQIMREFR